jgi:hypothetical protein
VSHCNVSPFPEQPAREHPLRTFARAIVAEAATDQRHGILAWRIADYLVGQLQAAAGGRLVGLEDLSRAEQDFYLRLATTAVAIVDSLDLDAPASPREVRRYELRKALALARARVTLDARHRRHDLGEFRETTPGHDLAVCRHCGVGVSIHLGTAGISVSAPLEQPCTAAR